MTAKDKITVTILADGTIKSETDAVSPANHQSAEEFLKDVARLTDGGLDRKRRAGVHTHAHGHHHHGHSH